MFSSFPHFSASCRATKTSHKLVLMVLFGHRKKNKTNRMLTHLHGPLHCFYGVDEAVYCQWWPRKTVARGKVPSHCSCAVWLFFIFDDTSFSIAHPSGCVQKWFLNVNSTFRPRLYLLISVSASQGYALFEFQGLTSQNIAWLGRQNADKQTTPVWRGLIKTTSNNASSKNLWVLGDWIETPVGPLVMAEKPTISTAPLLLNQTLGESGPGPSVPQIHKHILEKKHFPQRALAKHWKSLAIQPKDLARSLMLGQDCWHTVQLKFEVSSSVTSLPQKCPSSLFAPCPGFRQQKPSVTQSLLQYCTCRISSRCERITSSCSWKFKHPSSVLPRFNYTFSLCPGLGSGWVAGACHQKQSQVKHWNPANAVVTGNISVLAHRAPGWRTASQAMRICQRHHILHEIIQGIWLVSFRSRRWNNCSCQGAMNRGLPPLLMIIDTTCSTV